MVQRIETTGTVGPDGSLTIDHALDVAPGRRRLVLLIDPAPSEVEHLDWSSFVTATYGSLADISITREPEGDYEQRIPYHYQ